MKEFAEELRGKVRGLISEVVELHSHVRFSDGIHAVLSSCLLSSLPNSRHP
jgi:hypothetical protein